MSRRLGAIVIASLMVAVVTAARQSRPESSSRFIGQAEPPLSALSLWYRVPASDHPPNTTNAAAPGANAEWVRALPVGNGRLGAMVFGGVEYERLQLNEDTLWAGGPYNPVNPDARAALPDVRQLLAGGERRV